jgi:hypothetical protein
MWSCIPHNPSKKYKTTAKGFVTFAAGWLSLAQYSKGEPKTQDKF